MRRSPTSPWTERRLRHPLELPPEQFGAIHEILEAQCARLGMTTVPELYLSDAAEDGPARAYTDWKRHYIVLCTDYLEPDPATQRDVLAFQIGCELGRIRLGHTSLVNEVLLSFTDRIPLQAWLLSRVRVHSRDRYGAFLAPEGVRGLAVVATDRIPLGSLNVEAFMRDARAFVGFWSHAGGFLHERPFMAFRVRTLYDLGPFDWEHDLERFAQKGIREDADFPEEPETESA